MKKARKQPDWTDMIGKVTEGDAVDALADVPDGSVQLVIFDSPYNLAREYENHDDKLTPEEFLRRAARWLDQGCRVLAPNGNLFVLISEEFVSEIKVLIQGRFSLVDAKSSRSDLKYLPKKPIRRRGISVPGVARAGEGWDGMMIPRHHIIWYYTFGVNGAKKLTRSHTHILHFVKRKDHLWYPQDPANRVPSARQTVYNDPRANPAGRLPDDVWILRPETLPFDPGHDVWCFSRVNGTFKERQADSNNQLPEALVARMLTLSTRPGDLVLDQFSGSGTVAAVCKKLGRRFIALDNSPKAVACGNRRLDSISEGDPIGQAPEGRKETARRRKKAD